MCVFLGTLLVAAAAFLLAFGGTVAAARDAGMTRPWAFPLVIEGGILAAGAGTVYLGKQDRGLPWGILAGCTALSSSSNLMHAISHRGGTLPAGSDYLGWGHLVLAVVPPLLLPCCVRLVERVALKSRRDAARLSRTVAVPVPTGRRTNGSPAARRSTPGTGTRATVRPAGTVPRDGTPEPGGTAGPKWVCEGPCGQSLSRSKFYDHQRNGCPGHRREVAA